MFSDCYGIQIDPVGQSNWVALLLGLFNRLGYKKEIAINSFL